MTTGGFPGPDPRRFAEEPVVRALNGIALRALIGFVIVAAIATIPAIARLDEPIREAFHVAVPLAWLTYAVVTGALLALRPAPHEPSVWSRAAEVDPDLARFARRLSALMTIGWLVAVGAVIVNHHLGSPDDAAYTLLVALPITLAAWLLAVSAWRAWCRAALARGEHAALERLRLYWAGVARSRGAH
jgi:energy-converting hydrogenase Eha subunit A